MTAFQTPPSSAITGTADLRSNKRVPASILLYGSRVFEHLIKIAGTTRSIEKMRSDGLKSVHRSFRRTCVFLLIFLVVAFSGCSRDIAAYDAQLAWGNYESAFELANDMLKKRPGDETSLNRKALALIYLEREEEALPILDKILAQSPEDDTALNNKSWALYNLEQYDKSYEYILKSLAIEPNSAMEHINHGNVLLALEKFTEAKAAYTLALNMDDGNAGSLYGLGYAHYCLGEYEQAVEQFEQYIRQYPSDEDAVAFLGYSYLYSDEPEKTQEKVNDLYRIALNKQIGSSNSEDTNSNINFMALKLQAECEKYLGRYDQALEVLKKAPDNKKDDEYYSMLGDIHYTLGNYSESLQAYEQLARLSPDNVYPHIQNVYNYLALENVPAAFESAEKAIALEPQNEEALTALGNVYGWETQYRRAYDYFQQSVRANPDYVTGHVNSMWALYNSGLYRKCLEYGEAIVDSFPQDPDIYGYIGDSWAKLQETEKAVENYRKAAEKEENPVYFYFEIALEYFYDQQYDLAEAAIESALALEPENDTCLSLKDEIVRTKNPLSDRIAHFVGQNYLYSDKIKNLDSRLKQFSETSANASAVYDFIESIRLKEDLFTFCFAGEEYDLYWDLEEGKTVFYRQILQDAGKPVHYFDIDFFGFNTANEFIEIAEELPDKENSILVIDLRDNGGGLMESCAEMLDYLLESCVIGNLVYRDGTSTSWYSDEDAVTFEEIFVLINRNTASSSEMLALGLKKHLQDVTVIGEPSYGKGVGQTVFDSRKDKVAVMLVNFYWDIQDENLVNSSIKPDIKASGDLGEYLEKVRAALGD